MDFVRKGLQRKAHSEVITERGLEVQSPTANFDRNLQERPKDIKKSDFLGRILKGLLS